MHSPDIIVCVNAHHQVCAVMTECSFRSISVMKQLQDVYLYMWAARQRSSLNLDLITSLRGHRYQPPTALSLFSASFQSFSREKTNEAFNVNPTCEGFRSRLIHLLCMLLTNLYIRSKSKTGLDSIVLRVQTFWEKMRNFTVHSEILKWPAEIAAVFMGCGGFSFGLRISWKGSWAAVFYFRRCLQPPDSPWSWV